MNAPSVRPRAAVVVVAAAVVAVLAPSACRGRRATGADAARAPARAEPAADGAAARVPDGAVVVAADAAPPFAPHWACRVTGPGRFGPRPAVSVPAARPRAEPGTVEDSVALRGGGRLWRQTVIEGGAAALSRGRVVRTDARDAGQGELTYEVRAEAQEMLFEDAAGAGVAWLARDGRVLARRIGGAGEETLLERAGDPTRPCGAPPTDPLRLVPVAPDAWPFPSIAGIPPSVADARWTLARDARGLCVARLEGEGPWGRVFVDASENGMRGDLSLAESLNPVSCAPAP